MEGSDQVPLQFPSCFATIPEARRPLNFPAREKQRWNHFQRLCGLLGFCIGAVAADGGLTKSRQHCTEKQDGKKLTFRIIEAQQTSTEPLWGRQDIRGRKKGEWDAHHRTQRHLVWRMQVSVVLFVFGCLKINLRHWISHVEIRHDTESFMQMAREQAQQTPRRRRVAKCTIKLFLAHSKHSCVETTWHTQWCHLICSEDISLYTLVTRPTSEHFPMCPWFRRSEKEAN